MYKVLVSRKVIRSISKMPESTQLKMANLVEDLRDKGPIHTDRLAKLQPDWERRISLPSFKKMGGLLVLGKKNYRDRGLLCWQS